MRESSALRSMRGLLLWFFLLVVNRVVATIDIPYSFLAETEYDVGTSILNGSYVSTVKECLGYTFINHTAAVEHLGLAYSVGQNKTGRNYMIARMAAYKIGLIYEQGGFGVESSEIEAVRWLDLASKMGNCHAANTLGVFYEKKGSFQFLKYYELGTAVPCSDHRPFNEDKEAQRWGCANAAANLAYHYQTAETMDNKKATVYLDMMFEIGDYRMSMDLANLHFSGKGLYRNRSRAIEILDRCSNYPSIEYEPKMASELEMVQLECSQNLAFFYFNSWGNRTVKADYALSYKYWSQVANHNSTSGGVALMSTLLVQESRLYIARAYYYLGVGSELEQYGVPQLNATEAVTIFWDAAQGYDLTTVQEMAYSYLAVAYYEGRGVPRNYTTAFELADVASQTTEAHTVTAMIVLGNIYRRGLGGVEVDPQKAFGYFDAAAKYAAPLALLSMADMLYTKEVSRNVVQVETTDLDEMRTNTLISTSADDRVIALETALQILEQYYYPSEIQVMTWPSDIGNLVAHTWMKINKEREAQYHEQTPMNPYVIIAVSLGCLGVVVLCLLAGQYYITQRQKQRNLAKEIEVDAKKRGVKWITDRSLAYKLIGEWISSQGARNNAHIDQDSFAMLDLIGSGNFSDVYKAVTFIGSSAVICSVKVMKTQDPGAQFEFEREVELLSSLFHPNVVLVFGRCEGNVELGSIMVMEYMDYGSLHEELKWAASVARSDTTGSLSPYTDAEFLWFVHQACLGLEHLAENGIVHRDIAARNTLLGSFDKDLSAFRTLNMHDVKIADLGLSRRLDTAMTYQHQHARAMPMRTMAPESLSRNNPEHTEKSDVYMFGCFVWEVYSLGKLPYAHLVASENMQGYMLREKLSGMFLLQPETMPDAVYDICMDCWDPDPSERPTFRRLQVMLRDLFSEFRSVSVSDFASMNVRQDASNSGSDLSSKPSGFKSRLGKLGMGLGLGAVERSGNLVGGVKSKWKEWNTTGQSSSTLSAHSSLGLESSLSTSSNLAILGNDLTSKAEISPTDNMIYCGMRSAGSSEYSNSMLTSTLDMTEGGGAGMESTELSNNKDSQALHPQLPPATPKAIAQSQPQVQPPPARGMSAATTSRYAADTLTRLRKASYSSTQTHTPPPPRKASLLSHIFAAGSVVRAPHTQTRSSTGSALKFTVCNKALTAGTTSALNGRTVSSVVPETPSDASYDQLHAVYDDGKERRYTMLNTPTQIADEKEAQRRHTVTEGSGHSGLACEGDSASSADTLQSAHTSELTGTNSGMHTGMRAVVDSGREPGTRADGKATHYAGDEMMVKSTGYDGCVGSMNSTGDCADVTNTYAPVHSSRDSCPWHSEREPNAFGLKRADQSMEIYSNTSDESTTDFSSRTGNKGRRWQIVANANVANVANVDKMNIQGRKYRHNTPSTTNSSGELEVGEGQRQHVSRTNSDRGYAKDTEDAKANYSNSGSGLHFIGRQGSRRGSVDAKENIEGCGYRWHDAIRSLMGSYQGH